MEGPRATFRQTVHFGEIRWGAVSVIDQMILLIADGSHPWLQNLCAWTSFRASKVYHASHEGMISWSPYHS